MPVFACLITGSLHLEHDEGPIFDLGVSTVRYVHAAHEDEAREKSVKKFLNEESLGGKISNAKMMVEKVTKTKFWALWSKQAFWTWDLEQPDQKLAKAEAIKTALEWHKYIK